VQAITKIWDIDPQTLSVMRADLAVDIPSVPVPWFRDHARFKFKRFASRIDKATVSDEVEFVDMGTAISQTLYAGKRPNLIRIYDKREEWRKQWREEARNIERFNRGLKRFDFSPEEIEKHTQVVPGFDEFCLKNNAAVPPGQVLTRIERQVGGNRIPGEIDTVFKLSNLQNFAPFGGLELLAPESCQVGRPGPPGTEYGIKEAIRDHLAGIGFQTICQELGSMQLGCSYVTKHGKGNGRRVLESLQPYWPQTNAQYSVTAEQLQAAFSASVARQFASAAESASPSKGQDSSGDGAVSQVAGRVNSECKTES
jgi:hypothetical protein